MCFAVSSIVWFGMWLQGRENHKFDTKCSNHYLDEVQKILHARNEDCINYKLKISQHQTVLRKLRIRYERMWASQQKRIEELEKQL